MSETKKPATYRDAGVDIEQGDRFVDFIKSMNSKHVGAGLGGFSGGIEIDTTRYQKPVLLSCTDGVGTKLLVARKVGRFDTLGIDLVAMNVNDLVVCGAKPLTFLDYIACGKNEGSLLQELITGIVRGCEIADCILAGGETAEMPDVYAPDDFDLAGFAVGIVEKERMLPRLEQIKRSDSIFGLASSGIHSNGLSLARKVIPENDGRAWELLLTPTTIYVRELLMLQECDLVQGAAHITGSGLEANIERVLPENMKPRLFYDWPVPEVFDIIQKGGAIATDEMRRVFNMGIGMALIVKREDADRFVAHAKERGIKALRIGEVV